MTAAQPIYDALFTLLRTNAALTVLVGANGVFQQIPPQNELQPFVLISGVTDPVQPFFNAIDDIRMDFQVDSYSPVESGTKAVRAISDAVYAALHRQTMNATGYLGVSISCIDRGSSMDQDMIVGGRTQQDAWRVSQTYRIWGTGS